MPRRVFRIRGEPLLDVVSYGRGGPRENGGRLTPEQIDHIRRTVQRVPEVMVKVLPRASNDLLAAGKHLDYISRYGELPLEAEDGELVNGRRGSAILEEWDLDIDDVRRQAELTGTKGRKPPKLVHKLMFSMPAGTAPDKVLAAVRIFAREQFYGQHRYAFVLHTDEDHPHVHLVLKAVSEQGVRLNIKKATLRQWRSEFARNLRLIGVPASATERAVRGQNRKSLKDGIYRASLRGDSTYLRARAEVVAGDLFRRRAGSEPGKRKLVETRRLVETGWRSVATILQKEGQLRLAGEVRRFIDSLPAWRTDQESIGIALRDAAQRPLLPELPLVR